MDAGENKRLIQHIYDRLARGDSRALLDAMADDVCWTVMGTTRWSGIYQGKQEVLTRLLVPLRARFAERYTASARRVIGEGDLVVAEVHGGALTTGGMRYDQRYCFIFRLAGGKIAEMTEYMDTEMVSAALGDPGASV